MRTSVRAYRRQMERDKLFLHEHPDPASSWYEKEMKEAAILKEYLPKQLSDEELEARLRQIIEQVGASSMKDMGKVMGVATKELAGVADGKRINQMVKKILGS